MKPHIQWCRILSCWICLPFKGAQSGYTGSSPEEAYRMWMSWRDY